MNSKMTDKMIEEKLARAIDESAPDMLDSLMTELGISDESPVTLRDSILEKEEQQDVPEWKPVSAASDNKKIPAGLRKYITACAVLLFLIGGMSVFREGGAAETYAVVGLDVNPSIEIAIDRDEHVISADALNNDGKAVLDGMSLKGTDIKVACNAVIGSMLAKGYLSDTSNSVLVSVTSADAESGRLIESELAGNLNTFLESSEINGAILGMLVESDKELREFAKAHDISPGKAWLIRSLLSSGDTHLTEESLLMLSTQELILLGQEKHLSDDTSYGAADTSKYIGRDEAAAAAFEAAGVSSSQAEDLSVEFDAENGLIVYEVEFRSGGTEYEYNINASNGTVVSYESENAESGDIDDHDDDHDHDDDDHDEDDDHDDHDDHDDDD